MFAASEGAQSRCRRRCARWCGGLNVLLLQASVSSGPFGLVLAVAEQTAASSSSSSAHLGSKNAQRHSRDHPFPQASWSTWLQNEAATAWEETEEVFAENRASFAQVGSDGFSFVQKVQRYSVALSHEFTLGARYLAKASRRKLMELWTGKRIPEPRVASPADQYRSRDIERQVPASSLLETGHPRHSTAAAKDAEQISAMESKAHSGAGAASSGHASSAENAGNPTTVKVMGSTPAIHPLVRLITAFFFSLILVGPAYCCYFSNRKLSALGHEMLHERMRQKIAIHQEAVDRHNAKAEKDEAKERKKAAKAEKRRQSPDAQVGVSIPEDTQVEAE